MHARTYCLGLLAAAALLTACSEDELPAATIANKVETFTIGALLSTPVGTASGFRVSGASLVRTDLSSSYDFLYDIDAVVGPAFYPAEITGVIPPSDANPGLLLTTTPFDSIHSAKSNGYVTDAVVPVDSGSVLYLRSAVSCGIGVPNYGKLEVLSIDTAAHTLTFQVLVNDNCGYRGLDVGIPKN